MIAYADASYWIRSAETRHPNRLAEFVSTTGIGCGIRFSRPCAGARARCLAAEQIKRAAILDRRKTRFRRTKHLRPYGNQNLNLRSGREVILQNSVEEVIKGEARCRLCAAEVCAEVSKNNWLTGISQTSNRHGRLLVFQKTYKCALNATCHFCFVPLPEQTGRSSYGRFARCKFPASSVTSYTFSKMK